MECSICINKINENYTLLECGHQFCNECIGEWIQKNSQKNCPNCRCDIVKITIFNDGLKTEKHIETTTSIDEILGFYHIDNIDKSIFANVTNEDIDTATNNIKKMLNLDDDFQSFMSSMIKNVVDTGSKCEGNRVNIFDIVKSVSSTNVPSNLNISEIAKSFITLEQSAK
jgi:uncharacterized protein YjgD (DUF1641 family)